MTKPTTDRWPVNLPADCRQAALKLRAALERERGQPVSINEAISIAVKEAAERKGK